MPLQRLPRATCPTTTPPTERVSSHPGGPVDSGRSPLFPGHQRTRVECCGLDLNQHTLSGTSPSNGQTVVGQLAGARNRTHLFAVSVQAERTSEAASRGVGGLIGDAMVTPGEGLTYRENRAKFGSWYCRLRGYGFRRHGNPRAVDPGDRREPGVSKRRRLRAVVLRVQGTGACTSRSGMHSIRWKKAWCCRVRAVIRARRFR